MSEQHSEERSVAGDLCALLQSGEGADVTLVVGDAELSAHSPILAARSPVFAAALRHDMKEARSRRIEITDMQEEVLKELLLFLYGDKTPQLATMARELLAAAEKYDLPVLKKRCEQQMMRDISVENAAATVAFAVQYSCPELKSGTVEFIASHPKVMATGGWERVLRDSADVAVEACSQVAVALESRIISVALKDYLAPRLLDAARNSRDQEVCVLLTAGALRDARDSSGNTALHLATKSRLISTIKCLLTAGLDVNSVNYINQTPLHVAAENCYTDVIRMLVTASAQLDAQDKQGKTPLHVAVKMYLDMNEKNTHHSDYQDAVNRATAAVGALLLAGARKDIRDVNGKTPRQLGWMNVNVFSPYGNL